MSQKLEKQPDDEAYDEGKKEILTHGTITLEELDKHLGFSVQNRTKKRQERGHT
jgi:hypothetical protein